MTQLGPLVGVAVGLGVSVFLFDHVRSEHHMIASLVFLLAIVAIAYVAIKEATLADSLDVRTILAFEGVAAVLVGLLSFGANA